MRSVAASLSQRITSTADGAPGRLAACGLAVLGWLWASCPSLPAVDNLPEKALALAQVPAESANESERASAAARTVEDRDSVAGNEPSGAPGRDSEETTEGERQVLDFVRRHQPKLQKLLEFLKKQQPALYAQAIKEMSRSQQRLEGLAKRDSELYAIELQLWQVRSELRLLAAEMTVASKKSADPVNQAVQQQHKQRLSQLVQREAKHELARLELLKSRTQKQLAQLETQIRALSDSREEQIDRQIQLWQNRITKQSRK